ncbi:uncharacterized protein LOC117328913 [Pecten maximus]|uniref:uncharacterized protein LOC117328913 n=1 Tax=Pecten maximus TaxID=6579 RepID=UPI001458C653|nr:uncharacterized protein LOC117328913 [Pecten maximus]
MNDDMDLLYRLLLLDFTAILVTANPMMFNATLSVIGYFGSQNWQNMVVGNANASWIDAFEECRSLGYSIATASSTGNKFLHLRNFLFLHHPEFINVPLWTGMLKPNLDDAWYLRDQCDKTVNENVKNTYVNNTVGDRQCLLINMSVNAVRMAYTWYASSCFEHHPFICEQTIGSRPVDSYEDMQLQHIDSDTSVTISSNTTVEDCKRKLEVVSNVFTAEYNSTSKQCTSYTRYAIDLPIEVNLTVFSEDNTTISFVKSAENIVDVIQMSNVGYTDNYQITDLPCYGYGETTETTIVPDSTGYDYDILTETTTAPTPSLGDYYYDTLTETTTDPTPSLGVSSFGGPTETAIFPTSSAAVTIVTTTSTLDSSSSLNQWISIAKEENIVNEKTLSSYRNKRVSAYDSRPSSQAMGVLGAVFIAAVVSLIVMSDLPNIIRDLRRDLHERKSNKTKRTLHDVLFYKTKPPCTRRSSV